MQRHYLFNYFRRLGRFTTGFLLAAIFISLPLGNSILCIESDGTSSIENVPLGSCVATEVATQDLSSAVEVNHSDNEQEDCIDCTDVSLSQTLSTKLQSEFDYSIVPDILVADDMSYEVPIYTEPIVSFISTQANLPNQLHKHLQTIVLII